MQKLPLLKVGDSVELIAPASRCKAEELMGVKELLTSWQFNCIINKDIFGDDLLCANTDALRFQSLKNALENPKTKAVICVRGGYGSLRLIPQLAAIKPPRFPKLFVGMSDITALNLYLEQVWRWPTLHGAPALDKFSPESMTALKSMLLGEINPITFSGKPLNKLAENNHHIETTITGGNLCLVQTSIGTLWQIDGRRKIIFLEEIGERGYRIDRMLEHCRQANIFKDAAAILLGDFIEGKEPNGTSLIEPVLKRFAESCDIPVVQIEGLGHGYTSFPIPLGTKTILELGEKIHCRCFRG